MGDATRRAAGEPGPVLDPRATPVPRRRVLVLMGAGCALAAGGSLSTLLAACSGPPVPVRLDVDPESLVPGLPVEVPFTLVEGSSSVAGSTWLVSQASGNLVAFDPRCTHANCAYDWLADAARFRCKCHDGQFALDGTVLAGPPPRPLRRFPARVEDGAIVIDVPADFEAPKESLPS